MDTQREKKLKPCPFCGGTDLEVLELNKIHYVVCNDCDTCGPYGEFGNGEEKAIEAWNRRGVANAEALYST